MMVGVTLPLPAVSLALPEPKFMTTVPAVVMPVTLTLYVVPLPVTVTLLVPPAVPVIVTSVLSNPVTVSLKVTVKLTCVPEPGSA